ncbi:DUF3623 family protein [Roseovarius sp.]|uniref:DUF3623 family protein n=1 Tax=Roseovarius sp. TaxID=1486281 RepID=UPI003A97B5A0
MHQPNADNLNPTERHRAPLIIRAAKTADAITITGLRTFNILYFARISAKLNLCFALSGLSSEFLPAPLGH